MLPSEAEQGVLALVQVVQPSEAHDQFISWIHDITFAFYAHMQPCDPLIPILLRDVITDTHHISRLDSNMTAATPVLDEYESDETTKIASRPPSPSRVPGQGTQYVKTIAMLPPLSPC